MAYAQMTTQTPYRDQNSQVPGEKWFSGFAAAMKKLASDCPMRVDCDKICTSKSLDVLDAQEISYLTATRFALEVLEIWPRANTKTRKAIETIIGASLGQTPQADIFLLSVLFEIQPSMRMLNMLADAIFREDWTETDRTFLYWQIRHKWFSAGRMVKGDFSIWAFSFYKYCFAPWHQLVKNGTLELEWIDRPCRTSGSVFLLTNQLLGPRHGPSADVYGSAEILKNRFGKKVTLINTNDLAITRPVPPILQPVRFNQIAQWDDAQKLTLPGLREESVSYQQTNVPMPDAESIVDILEKVKKEKPEFILSFGGSSITADLCARMVPVWSLPFGAMVPFAFTQGLLCPNSADEADFAFARSVGLAEDSIQHCQYMFARLPSEGKLKRADIGIPEDAFVVVIIGNRLPEEMKPDFLALLDRCVQENSRLFLVLTGSDDAAETLKKNVESFPLLHKHSVLAGHRTDVVDILRVCDVYLNPPRAGGAGSAAVALLEGLPVLSQSWGDVAGQCCGEGAYLPWSDGESLGRLLKTLQDDPERMTLLQDTARKRGEEVTDRVVLIRDILHRVETLDALDREPWHPALVD